MDPLLQEFCLTISEILFKAVSRFWDLHSKSLVGPCAGLGSESESIRRSRRLNA